MPSHVRDKVILITGASSGIGWETALLFARKGARLVLAARSADRLEALAEKIHAFGSEALPAPTDVTHRPQVEATVRAALERFGGIDILINNAGVGYFGPLWTMPTAEIQRIVDVNLWGVLHCTQAVLPHMISRRSGQIINISSVVGKRAFPDVAVYCATKFAVVGLGEALRHEVRRYGIRVITICPTTTDTPFFEKAGSDGRIKGPRSPISMSAEDAAKAIFRASRRGSREVVLSVSAKVFVRLNAYLPGLLDRLIGWTMDRRD